LARSGWDLRELRLIAHVTALIGCGETAAGRERKRKRRQRYKPDQSGHWVDLDMSKKASTHLLASR